ncbi:hypothetical protein Slin15195_G098510 [Septoria linicola]|uniref:Uncharacterized protein n=1 Tax=Septoria linicola TaxID=215465 RepID=A0A9Q9B336_9PEZI|nr:hypothetical protein Slin14017_G061570 [Septoria linicola]USW56532.1 hypothetical protein Slin15195_G098510 [Septoria linicola]
MKSSITAAIILAIRASQVTSAPLPFPQGDIRNRLAVCPPWCGAGSIDDDAWREFRELTGQNNIKPPTTKRGEETAEPDIWSKLRPERHGNFYQVHRRDALSVTANPDGTIPKKSQEAIDRWNAQFGTLNEQHNGETLSVPTNPDGGVSKEWQDAVNRWELRLDDTTIPPREQQKREALPAAADDNDDGDDKASSWEVYNRLPDPSGGAPYLGKLFDSQQEKREALPVGTNPLQLSHEAIDRLNRKLGFHPQQKKRGRRFLSLLQIGVPVSRGGRKRLRTA